MKKLVQQWSTGLYLTTQGTWESDLTKALNFRAVADAVAFCVERNLRRDVQLVLLMDGGAMTLELFPEL